MLAQAEAMKAEAKDFDSVKAMKEIADLFTPIRDGARVVKGEDPITGEKHQGRTGTFLVIYHSTCESRKYGVKGFKFVAEGIEDINKMNKKADKVKAVEKSTEKASGGNIKSDDIKFGSSVKSTKKVNNQMKKRGWSEESVKDVVDHPHSTRKSVNKATGNGATVFYDKDGSYVIIDDKTKEIVQISDKFDKNWVPDAGIVDPYKPKGGK